MANGCAAAAQPAPQGSCMCSMRMLYPVLLKPAGAVAAVLVLLRVAGSADYTDVERRLAAASRCHIAGKLCRAGTSINSSSSACCVADIGRSCREPTAWVTEAAAFPGCWQVVLRVVLPPVMSEAADPALERLQDEELLQAAQAAVSSSQGWSVLQVKQLSACMAAAEGAGGSAADPGRGKPVPQPQWCCPCSSMRRHWDVLQPAAPVPVTQLVAGDPASTGSSS